MYEELKKDLRDIGDWLFAFKTSKLDCQQAVSAMASEKNWYKTIYDAADAISNFQRLLSENATLCEVTFRATQPYIEKIYELESDRSELTNEVARLKEQVYSLTPNKKIMESMTNVIKEQADEIDRLKKSAAEVEA